MADHPGWLREGGPAVPRAVPRRGHLHDGLRPRAVAAGDHERAVHTSFLDRLPAATRIYPRLLPFMNAAFESFDLGGYDRAVEQPRLREERDHGARDAARVLLPHADALRLGPGLLRGRRWGWPSGPRCRCSSAACDARTRSRRPGPMPTSRTRVTSPRGSASTTARFDRDPPARRRPALPRRAAPGRRLLPVPRPARPLQARRPRRGGLREARQAAQGRRRRGGETLAELAGRTELLGFVEDDALAEIVAGARALLFPGRRTSGWCPSRSRPASP